MEGITDIIRHGSAEEKAALVAYLRTRIDFSVLRELLPPVIRREGDHFFVAAAEPAEQDSTELLPMEQTPANV